MILNISHPSLSSNTMLNIIYRHIYHIYIHLLMSSHTSKAITVLIFIFLTFIEILSNALGINLMILGNSILYYEILIYTDQIHFLSLLYFILICQFIHLASCLH